MAVTFLVEGVRSSGLDVVVSPLAELGAILHLMTDPEHHAPFRDHGRRLRAALPPELADELEGFAPLWTGYRCRLLYPLSPLPHRELDDELSDILALAEDRFLEAYLWGALGGPTGAPVLSPDTEQVILARARQRGQAAFRLAGSALLDPARERARFVEMLTKVAEQLSSERAKVTSPLLADAHARRTVVENDGTAAALIGLTPGSRLVSNPERVVFDKLHHGIIDLRRRPVIAIPSVFGWPHLLVKHELGWPALAQYPLGPAVVRRETPPAALMRKRLIVLSHPGRIRVCRLLTREQLSTSELARLLGVSAPQMSRLLKPMREAGLLRSRRDGHFVRYQLDLDAIGQLGADLVGSLLR